METARPRRPAAGPPLRAGGLTTVGRGRRDDGRARHHGRLPLDGRRADRAAARRVRLEPRHDLAALSGQPALYGLFAPFAAALHERFGIRRVTIGGAASRSPSRRWRRLRITRAVAAAAALGPRDRLAPAPLGDPAGGDRGQPLVRARRGLVTEPDGDEQRDRPARVPAAPGRDRGLAGWRWACALIALVAVFVVLPLAALLLRDRPADVGLPPYGGDVDGRAAAARPGSPFGAAFARPRAGRAARARSGCWPAASSSAAPRPTA